MDPAAILAFLTSTTGLAIIGIVAGGVLLYVNRDAIKAKLGLTGGAIPSLDTIAAQIANLPLMKQLSVEGEDVHKTIKIAMLVKLNDDMTALTDADDRQAGIQAINTMQTLLMQGTLKTGGANPSSPATPASAVK